MMRMIVVIIIIIIAAIIEIAVYRKIIKTRKISRN